MYHIMADDTPAAPAPEAAEPSVTPAEAKPAENAAPEAPKEKEETNGSEEKPSGKQCRICSSLPRLPRARREEGPRRGVVCRSSLMARANIS